jgi:hypothetical protein
LYWNRRRSWFPLPAQLHFPRSRHWESIPRTATFSQ